VSTTTTTTTVRQRSRVAGVVPDRIGGRRPTATNQTRGHRTRLPDSSFRPENPTATGQILDIRRLFRPATTTTGLPNSSATTILRATVPGATAVLRATVPDPAAAVLVSVPDGVRIQRRAVHDRQP